VFDASRFIPAAFQACGVSSFRRFMLRVSGLRRLMLRVSGCAFQAARFRLRVSCLRRFMRRVSGCAFEKFNAFGVSSFMFDST